jgi:hypothetical protein
MEDSREACRPDSARTCSRGPQLAQGGGVAQGEGLDARQQVSSAGRGAGREGGRLLGTHQGRLVRTRVLHSPDHVHPAPPSHRSTGELCAMEQAALPHHHTGVQGSCAQWSRPRCPTITQEYRGAVCNGAGRVAPPSHRSTSIVYGSTKGFVSYGGITHAGFPFTHVGFPLPHVIRLVSNYHSPLSLPLPSRRSRVSANKGRHVQSNRPRCGRYVQLC